MITHTVTIKDLGNGKTAIDVRTRLDNETPAEVAEAEIFDRHIKSAAEEITQRMAENGPVSLVSFDPKKIDPPQPPQDDYDITGNPDTWSR